MRYEVLSDDPAAGLTASGRKLAKPRAFSTVGLDKVSDWVRPSFTLDKEWQTTAYRTYDGIGELAQAYLMMARTVARGRFNVMEEVTTVTTESGVDITENPPDSNAATGEVVNDKGHLDTEGANIVVEPKVSENPIVLRVMRNLRGQSGGQTELIRIGALNHLIAGESHFLGSPLESSEGQSEMEAYIWEFLSVDELVPNEASPSNRAVRHAGWTRNEGVDINGYIQRMVQRDPRHSDRADCALRHALPLGVKIQRLEQLLEAVIDSRLPAGVLLIPESLSWSVDEEEDDWGEEHAAIDPFLLKLVEHMSAPRDNAMSKASLVPLILRGDPDELAAVRLIDVAHSLDVFVKELMEYLLERFARALDLPPEIINGTGDSSHWSAANIESELLQKHIIPIGEFMAEFLTESYLRVILRDSIGWNEQKVQRFWLEYDPSPLVSKGDQSQKTFAALKEGLISKNAARRELGYDESDAPDGEELMIQRLVEWYPSSPSQIGPVLFPLLGLEPPAQGFGGGAAGPSGGAAFQPKPLSPAAQKYRDKNGLGGDKIPAEGNEQPETDNSQIAASVLIERLTTAADYCVQAAVVRAANRLKSYSNKSDHLHERCKAVKTDSELLASVGHSELRKIGLTEDTLLDGSFDSFTKDARIWVRDWLVSQGHDQVKADDLAARSVQEMTAGLVGLGKEAFARELQRNGNGLRVPSSLVTNALIRGGAVRPVNA